MNGKKFSYPLAIKATKVYCKILFPLFVLATIYIWLTKDPNAFQSRIEYLMMMIFFPIFSIFIFFFLYSYSDISIEDKGLWVEFIRRPLFIPWEDIVSIQYHGLQKFGVWLIKTRGQRLTIFHRTYSFFYTGLLQPGFLIHPQINSESELIGEIKRRMKCTLHAANQP